MNCIDNVKFEYNNIGKSDMSYINCAKQISIQTNHKHKIGCVIVSGHRIIGSGHNSDTKTVPLQAMLDSKHFQCECSGKVHAETEALLPFVRHHVSLAGATIYTFRQRKDGTYGCARPCPRCMQVIKMVGIKKLVYTTNDGIAKEKLT